MGFLKKHESGLVVTLGLAIAVGSILLVILTSRPLTDAADKECTHIERLYDPKLGIVCYGYAHRIHRGLSCIQIGKITARNEKIPLKEEVCSPR